MARRAGVGESFASAAAALKRPLEVAAAAARVRAPPRSFLRCIMRCFEGYFDFAATTRIKGLLVANLQLENPRTDSELRSFRSSQIADRSGVQWLATVFAVTQMDRAVVQRFPANPKFRPKSTKNAGNYRCFRPPRVVPTCSLPLLLE